MATRAEANKARATHGQAVRGRVTRLYRTWLRMHQRCSNPNTVGWANYGGRGILVCVEWFDFCRFAADMGDPPSPKHSLDRKNNDLGYTKHNCRWATKVEQDNNRSSNRRFTFQGRTMTVKQWADETGLKYATLYHRLCISGWPPKKALRHPVYLGLRPEGA